MGFNWEEYRGEAERATYDPDDDKIRIYTDFVPREMYDAFREAGFSRAPKQGCFFQVWTPHREDIALILCDEIEEEDTTLQERAEDREYRFATYSGNAARRASERTAASKAITDHIPLGQPILVGHHSEKRHRKDLERAQNHASAAVQEFKRRDYWSWRARGVLRHAAYKFNPGTIARRIKKLEAARRKKERERSWSDNTRAWAISDWIRDNVPEDERDYWTELKDLSKERQDECLDAMEAKECATAAWADRWIEHYSGQIEYWETIYAEVSGGEDVREQREIKKGYWVQNQRGTWAQVVRVNRSPVDKAITTVSIDLDTVTSGKWELRRWEYERIVEVKTPEEYEAMTYAQREAERIAELECQAEAAQKRREAEEADVERKEAEAQAKAANGIEIAVNYDPDYYPTPKPVIERMVALLDVEKVSRRVLGGKVLALEPSAGDGRMAEVLRAMPQVFSVLCCETDPRAREILRSKGFDLVGSDFLEYRAMSSFSAILMNPPFSRNQFFHHLSHAYSLLAPGGRLVSVAPQSHRDAFRNWLEEVGAYIENLPDGSFAEVGTQYPTMIVAVSKPEAPGVVQRDEALMMACCEAVQPGLF